MLYNHAVTAALKPLKVITDVLSNEIALTYVSMV